MTSTVRLIRFNIVLAICFVLFILTFSTYDIQTNNYTNSQYTPVEPLTKGPFLEAGQQQTRNNARQDIVTFTNVTATVGLGGVNSNYFAWGDYNNDGNQDLLVGGGRLFRNNGAPDHTFTEVTAAVNLTGSGMGTWADYDNDGNLDLYCAGSDILWHNEGSPDYRFTDVTVSAGNIRDDYPTTAVGWGDYDLDGYLDLYVANGEDWNDGDPIYFPDFLYHNNADGTFTDVTAESGIRTFGGPYYGRGVAWGDFDDDGWPDIYISNYRISPNWLFYNNRNGTFTDVALVQGVAGEESTRMGITYYGHTVGSAWADLDNDGDLDLFESDLAHKDLYRGPICGDSQLYRNDGEQNNYAFTDVRVGSGIPEKAIGGGEDELFVGIAIGDFDNDGFQDLFIPQIYDLEYSYSYLYHNQGNMQFINVSDDAGIAVWNTYGGAWCDYNNDGFLDLVTGGKGSSDPNASYEVHLYKNNGNTNSWLHVNLRGKHYNSFGIGTRVTVTTGSSGSTGSYSQIREVEGGMGAHSMQNSIPVEFGFGDYDGTVDIEVSWPSGYVQKLEEVNLNQIITIQESSIAPDLTFINVKSLESNPVQGDTITLEASIANMGYQNAERAVIRFYDRAPSEAQGGIPIGDGQVITELGKFQSTRVEEFWDTTGAGGEHEIWAVIEEVEPPELIITNNALNTTVSIRMENVPPVARLTVTPTEDIDPGETVTFDGSGSTDDTEVEYYYFDFGDGNNSGWISNSKLNYQYSTHGQVTASLLVKDPEGTINTNQAHVGITIKAPPIPNRAPIIEKFSANPTELEPNEESKLKILATDPDNDELTYHFFAGNGELTSNIYSSSATWYAPDQDGAYSITAKVFDGELYSDIANVEIKVVTVQVNNRPEIEDITIDPFEVRGGENVLITVEAFDPDDGDELAYNYETTAGEIIGTGSEVVWRAPLVPDIYFIKIEVVDLGGLFDDEEVAVNVLAPDYRPEILDGSVTPSTIKNDEAVSVIFSVEVRDENGLDDILTITIDLTSLDGKDDQALYDNGKYGDKIAEDGVFSYEEYVTGGTSIGVKTLEVTVKDRAGNEVTYELQITVEQGSSDKKSEGYTPGFDGLFLVAILLLASIFYSSTKIKKKK